MSKKRVLAPVSFREFLFFILIVFLTASCDDEPQILGLNLIPDSDKVNAEYVDTFTVFAHTNVVDSVYSGNNSVVSIGNYHDPIFGFTNARFISEFYPLSDSIRSTNPTLDSIKLVLIPSSVAFGDSSGTMSLKIYKYSKALPDDSSLYSNYKVEESELELIGEGTYLSNQEEIEIFLDHSFGNELIKPSDYSIDVLLDSLELFNSEFPAIYFETEAKQNKGTINYFRFGSYEDAFISLHYSYPENDSTNATLFYSFADGLGVHKNISLFEHDYSNASFNPQSTGMDSVIYIQSLGGTQGILQIPGLDDAFLPNAVTINSAKLIVPLEDFDKSRYVFTRSSHIGITAITNDNSEYYLSDNNYYQTDRSGNISNYYLDGRAIQDSLYYQMNITSHISSIVNGENENLGFNLFSANSSLRKEVQIANRMVITNHLNSNPIKLRIVYTKLAN